MTITILSFKIISKITKKNFQLLLKFILAVYIHSFTRHFYSKRLKKNERAFYTLKTYI